MEVKCSVCGHEAKFHKIHGCYSHATKYGFASSVLDICSCMLSEEQVIEMNSLKHAVDRLVNIFKLKETNENKTNT